MTLGSQWKRKRNELHRELQITCSLRSSWLEIWSDWSPSALVFSSVTFCSNSLRLSSTSDNVYKRCNIFNKKARSYVGFLYFVSALVWYHTSICLDAGLSTVPAIFCSNWCLLSLRAVNSILSSFWQGQQKQCSQ